MSLPTPSGRTPGRSPFDAIRHVEENSDGTEFEYWSAREAMALLGYVKWENMENVIRKARSACRNAGHDPGDHFPDVRKHQVGSQVPFRDVQMTRFGMYLLAMNGDPEKPEIAAAQRYFVIQTRRAEVHLPPIASPPVPPPAPVPRLYNAWEARFRASFRPHLAWVRGSCAAGAFTVVSAAIPEILDIEDELHRHLIMTHVFDRPDVSIGLRWAAYRREHGWGPVLGLAPLCLPNVGITVDVSVFSGSERADFDAWLSRRYLPEFLFLYFEKKKEMKPYGQLTRASAADNSSRQLAGRPAVLPDSARRQLTAAGGFAPARALPPAI